MDAEAGTRTEAELGAENEVEDKTIVYPGLAIAKN